MEAEGRAAMEELCAMPRPATGQNCSPSEKFTLGIVLVPTHSIPSLYFRGHPLNLRHVVVLNRSRVTVVPRNGDITPCGRDHCSYIGGAMLPANFWLPGSTNAIVPAKLTFVSGGADFDRRLCGCFVMVPAVSSEFEVSEINGDVFISTPLLMTGFSLSAFLFRFGHRLGPASLSE